MINIAFILSMPNVGSWNSKWSASDNLHSVVRRYPAAKKDVIQRILANQSYRYDFGDGWTASVKPLIVSGKEINFHKKTSKGFCGYAWMIDNIEQFGEIRKNDQIN